LDDSAFSRYYPGTMPRVENRRDPSALQPSFAAARRWLFLASLAGLTAILVPPCALAYGHPIAAALGYFFFSPICHQLPDRAWQLFGHPLALCARCTGLMLGVTLGTALGPFMRQDDRPPVPRRQWLLLSILIMVADIAAPWAGWYQNTLLSRSFTGVLVACLAAPYLVVGCAELAAILAKEMDLNFLRKKEIRGEIPS
jgi:uncharacterized membrane protein